MLDNLMSVLMSIRVTDVIDIAIVAYLIYKVLEFIRETRAQQLLRGVFLLVVVFFASDLLNLNLLNWLLKSLLTMGLFAVVVIFQPELRRGLEKVGRKFFTASQFRDGDDEPAMGVVEEIVDACEEFSKTRTGALIVIEKDTRLNELLEKGAEVDAKISARLLGNLFYEGSPLHDGAVIIRGTRILAASCVLPLTEKKDIGRNLGTRHRAGLGLSEVSDALVIIVSEESGAISVAENGSLKRFVDVKALEKLLLEIYVPAEKVSRNKFFRFFGLGGGDRDE
ncbi:MAG: diadenylate cyclase CdaA [Clostridiales bacterium]|nr:diadenylate cyclase CdaA [Candidatus Crickella merdequi]